MFLIIISFLAGVLTILAPCVLPLLPVILGASVNDSKNKNSPYIIILSLGISIIIFSLLLKFATIFIGVNPIVWQIFSAVILIIFGIITIFPDLWKNFSTKIGFSDTSNKLLGKSSNKKGIIGNILVGLSLGPVFSSCSPTYGIILAVILPVSLLTGLINLFAYVLGLSLILLFIAILGQKFILKLKWASSQKSKFKKVLGILFIVVGLAIMTGFDKKIETKILDNGYFDVTEIENKLLKKVKLQVNDITDKNNKVSEKELLKSSVKKTIKTNSKVDFRLSNFGLKTNTNKISINFDDILNGGPGKDGIPSINNPKFIENGKALENMKFLSNDSNGISVEINGEAKFYPYEIIVWHEIVNDTVGTKKIAITFCPLCGSAIVYSRVIKGEEVIFGVSGLLYQSNLLMYDNKTESLWSQSIGKAVVGDLLGKELEYIKSNLMNFKEFRNKYLKGKVLSSDTGFSRSYGIIPYKGYNTSDNLYFPVKNKDSRFNKKEIFYIINDSGESMAFLLKDLREKGYGKIIIGDKKYKASFKDGIVDVKLGNKILKGYYEMWFSWINNHVGNKNIWFNK